MMMRRSLEDERTASYGSWQRCNGFSSGDT